MSKVDQPNINPCMFCVPKDEDQKPRIVSTRGILGGLYVYCPICKQHGPELGDKSRSIRSWNKQNNFAPSHKCTYCGFVGWGK